MRTQRETDLEDEIELLSEQLLASYARIDELESALRGYVKATTGQESATVTFPMALEGEHDMNDNDRTVLEVSLRASLKDALEYTERQQAHIDELNTKLEILLSITETDEGKFCFPNGDIYCTPIKGE